MTLDLIQVRGCKEQTPRKGVTTSTIACRENSRNRAYLATPFIGGFVSGFCPPLAAALPRALPPVRPMHPLKCWAYRGAAICDKGKKGVASAI